jgi:hypothetical protein
VAAGFAPAFPERSLDDPALDPARRAIDHVLASHEPYPALAIDRHWTLVASNNSVAPFLAGVSPALLQPPVNVLQVSLHPEGVAPRIANLPEWRAHLFARLGRQIDLTADPVLIGLLEELRSYPSGTSRPFDHRYGEVAVPIQIVTDAGRLDFLSTTMMFGTPIDITLSELALEFFFPANAATAEALRRSAGEHD